MPNPNFGFQFVRDATEPAPPSNAIMSIVGLVGPAKRQTIAGETTQEASDRDAAFAAQFPLDTPVMFNSTDAAAATIDTTGNIGDAIRAVNGQVGRMQFSARIIFVRTADPTGADDAAKLASATTGILGSSASGTGIYAFKRAGAICGAYPRLICVPGYDHQIVEPATANPIVAALPDVLNPILAHAVVDCPNLTEQGEIDFRETTQSERILPVSGGCKVYENGIAVTRPLAPRIVGVGVRRDFEYEGRPFRSWANQPIYDIIGPARNIDFNLTDGACEGQNLLGHQIGILVRGESGDDFAIADGGFVYIGYDNAGETAIWQQYHKVRGRDFIELTAMRTLRYYLGRYNLTAHTIQAVINTVGAILSIAQAKGDLLGYLCRFDPDQNNPSDLRAGKLYIDARFEESPMFRLATMLSRPYSPALDATIAALASNATLTETSISSMTSLLPAA